MRYYMDSATVFSPGVKALAKIYSVCQKWMASCTACCIAMRLIRRETVTSDTLPINTRRNQLGYRGFIFFLNLYSTAHVVPNGSNVTDGNTLERSSSNFAELTCFTRPCRYRYFDHTDIVGSLLYSLRAPAFYAAKGNLTFNGVALSVFLTRCEIESG